MVKMAVYVDDFDTLTNRHLWMIEKGGRIFEQLIVVIMPTTGSGQTTLLKRLEILVKATKHIKNVHTELITNQSLLDYAVAVRCHFVLREIPQMDNEVLEQAERYSEHDITTVFLNPPKDLIPLTVRQEET